MSREPPGLPSERLDWLVFLLSAVAGAILGVIAGQMVHRVVHGISGR